MYTFISFEDISIEIYMCILHVRFHTVGNGIIRLIYILTLFYYFMIFFLTVIVWFQSAVNKEGIFE